MLERFTIRPQPASVMCCWVARLIRKAPRRWTLITESQSTVDILNSRLSRVMPALLTSTVGAPRSDATRSTADCTAASSATSAADGDGLAAEFLDGGNGVGAGGLVEVEYGDLVAVRGQSPAHCGADAASSSGHDGGALGDVHAVLLLVGRLGRWGSGQGATGWRIAVLAAVRPKTSALAMPPA